MLSICLENPADYPAIREILTKAFGQPNEARLVEKLRESPDFIRELSLVAEWHGILRQVISRRAVARRDMPY